MRLYGGAATKQQPVAPPTKKKKKAVVKRPGWVGVMDEGEPELSDESFIG